MSANTTQNVSQEKPNEHRRRSLASASSARVDFGILRSCQLRPHEALEIGGCESASRVFAHVLTICLRSGGQRGHCSCAPWKGVDLQWVQFPPGNWVAPAGSNRSDGGGNET